MLVKDINAMIKHLFKIQVIVHYKLNHSSSCHVKAQTKI